MIPEGGLEPSSDLVGAGEVITLIRCYLRSHFMQVLMRGIQGFRKRASHLHPGADDEDVVGQDIA